MKINKNKNKKIIIGLIGLVLVIIGNFGGPRVLPIYDVVVAISLSIFTIFFTKKGIK